MGGNDAARRWDLPDLTRLMLATGCRVGECLALGWTEVDLDGGTPDICWRQVRRTGTGLLRLPSTESGKRGDRIVPLPEWAVDMLRERRAVIGPGAEPVFPDSLGGWRDPNNVRRAWREVRDQLAMDGLVTHTLRKTVASFLDDANVTTRRISDQLGHAQVSMTQDRYLGRRLTDRQTADVLEGILPGPDSPVSSKGVQSVPPGGQQVSQKALTWEEGAGTGIRTRNRPITSRVRCQLRHAGRRRRSGARRSPA